MKISNRIKFMLLLLSGPVILPAVIALIGLLTNNQILAIVSGSIAVGSMGGILWTMLMGYFIGLNK